MPSHRADGKTRGDCTPCERSSVICRQGHGNARRAQVRPAPETPARGFKKRKNRTQEERGMPSELAGQTSGRERHDQPEATGGSGSLSHCAAAHARRDEIADHPPSQEQLPAESAGGGRAKQNM